MDERDQYEKGVKAGIQRGAFLGALSRQVMDEYATRDTSRRELPDLLAREGLLQDDHLLLQVGIGPSPHLAWELAKRLPRGGLHFTTDLSDFLFVHKDTYRRIKARERGPPELQEYWHLGDPQEDPYLITGKNIILENYLPPTPQGRPPANLEEMKVSLSSLLEANPSRVAIYTLKNPTPIGEALRLLGLSYHQHDAIASADFQPQNGGTLCIADF